MAGRGLLANKGQFQRISPGIYRGANGQVVRSATNPGRPQMNAGTQRVAQNMTRMDQAPVGAVGRQGNVPGGFGSMGTGPMQQMQPGFNGQGPMQLPQQNQGMQQNTYNAWGPTAGMNNFPQPVSMQGGMQQQMGGADPRRQFLQGQMSGGGYGQPGQQGSLTNALQAGNIYGRNTQG